MSVRVPVGDVADSFEAVSLVKLRCLIFHGIDIDVLAATFEGEAFGFCEEGGADAFGAPFGMDGHDGDAQPGELGFSEEAAYCFAVGVSEEDEGPGSVGGLLQMLHEGWIHGPVVLAQPLADEVAAGGGGVGGVDEAPGELWIRFTH